MPDNWGSIAANKIVTGEDITNAVEYGYFVPKPVFPLTNRAKGLNKAEVISDLYLNESAGSYPLTGKTNTQLVAKRNLIAIRPRINIEQRTISVSAYNGLDSYDKANFSKDGYKLTQNSSGTSGTGASIYSAGEQFYYAFHFTNTGTLITKGNVVFTITIPDGLSCVLSGGQPIITHLRGGATPSLSIPATLSGNTLTITITEATDVYNINTNPAAYHISVKMVATLYSGWNNGVDSFGVPNLQTVATTAYGENSPLSYSFYNKINFSTPTITKTAPYIAPIPYNDVFNYTLKLGNSSIIPATGIVVTDTLPNGLTYDSVPSKPTGWSVSVSGQLITISGGSDSIPANYSLSYYTITLRVRATGQNINISNTATVCSSNGFCASNTKSDSIDYDRTPTLTPQGFTTCVSGVNTAVYRDTNVNSYTNGYYYVNGTSTGSTSPPSSAACYFDSAYTTYTVSSTVYYTRNNCGAGSTPETIAINSGDVYGVSPAGQIRSYTSQADADSQAATYAYNDFVTKAQQRANSIGVCTWSSTQTRSYSQGYTKDNCGYNCYGSGVIYYGNSQTRTATSTSSQVDADNIAANDAYNAAYAVVQSNGQAYANSVGSCCCWVSDPTCDGCTRRANRERNTCDGSYRNTDPTEYNSCTCGIGCQGTDFTSSWYCDNRDKVYKERYNCNPSVFTGNENRVNCGCDSGAIELTSQGYNTCVGCNTYTVYKNTNRCSGTADHYYVNGSDVGTGAPSNGGCNTSPNYNQYRGIRCSGGNNYDVYENSNTCGGNRYLFTNPEPVGLSDFTTNSFENDQCSYSAFREDNFTRNNCPNGYSAGTVYYSNTYYYSGLLNQSGANNQANIYFNGDGQNYANSNASCTPPVSCSTVDIIAYSDGYYVDGQYTFCGGGTGYFSYYASTSGVIGTVYCAQNGSIYITNASGGAGTGSSFSC